MHINRELTVVVSGGASGLGEGVARHLAVLGAKVGIFDLNEDAGQKVADEIGGAFAKVDVSDSASVAQGFEHVRGQLGQERVMVNCAGIAPGAKTVDRDGNPHDAGLFAKTLGVNLIGSFNCASQSAAGMVKTDALEGDGERGVIINTASVAAYEGQIGQIAYSASKGGIVGMTLPMARDLSRDGVRVLSIAPGIFLTPMMKGFSQEVQDSLAENTPFPKRLGHPEDFAKLVEHIIINTMLNGETIRLDGAVRLQPR
ncbi:NAD(P)-dependent dehydrogenase (short-subunit alcohol dehydrogenase family) [Maritalea mobilis]|uniref:NAD(P)-dependent dehydrogenase (Short-subunit alcohol dehydrogenase family) n=1 Tax=Maritalea mobilis TaxID=483324 RepID=A0A4R6VJV5_9HYPH|nr:SDR family NAD(P)-dependent oxidoreductase [Maritalea mobilis]TDQ62002.1 NAD(P)-dependent dehydrogenase (short-subunit alcohol dehydrogenase family) [Maritalea mobilis]